MSNIWSNSTTLRKIQPKQDQYIDRMLSGHPAHDNLSLKAVLVNNKYVSTDFKNVKSIPYRTKVICRTGPFPGKKSLNPTCKITCEDKLAQISNPKTDFYQEEGAHYVDFSLLSNGKVNKKIVIEFEYLGYFFYHELECTSNKFVFKEPKKEIETINKTNKRPNTSEEHFPLPALKKPKKSDEFLLESMSEFLSVFDGSEPIEKKKVSSVYQNRISEFFDMKKIINDQILLNQVDELETKNLFDDE